MEITSDNKIFSGFDLKEYIIITIGTIIVAFGVYFFVFPNHFSMGGVAGLSILISKLLSVSQATTNMIINIIFLVLGFIVFGKKFGIKTAYASVLLSFTIYILEKYIPITTTLTDEPLLELFFAILLPSIGQAMLFNTSASTGGTDIMAMILKKFTSLEIGTALLLSDILITLSTFLVFDVKTGLFSILGLLSKSLLVNQSIESFNMVKYFTIVTAKDGEITKFINEVIRRGTTKIDAQGGYTDEKRKVILTVVNRSQAIVLRDGIKKIDPDAFIMITNTSQIIGKGFKID